MVKFFALVTEVALSSMGLDRVGCSKGVRFSMVWIWVVFQGRFFSKVWIWMVFKVYVFSLMLDSGGFFRVRSFQRFGSGCFRFRAF